jgi:hypothetical protein
MLPIKVAPRGLEYVIDTCFDPDKPYILLNNNVYYSPRYKKYVMLFAGDCSDGATGAIDILSRGWWFHDKLCVTGTWMDGTRLTNYQCSQVLYDILWSEGRYFRALYWKWSTFALGGGKARENGMVRLSQ